MTPSPAPLDERANAAFYAAAACRDQPPIYFDAVDPEDQLAERALAVCARCTVVEACLLVIRPGETWFDGVAAGMVWFNGSPRGTEKASSPVEPLPQCGTEYGYEVHRRRRERACDLCRGAKAAARRERRGKPKTGAMKSLEAS